MNALARLAVLLDQANAYIGRACAWLALVMVLLYCLLVFLRYALDIGSIALQEAVVYMHACLFFLSAAWVLRKGGHVRVDIFYQRFSPKTQAWVDLLGTWLFLLPVNVFILAVGWAYVADAWAVRESSAEPGGLPWVYLLKTVMLVAAIQMLMQVPQQSLDALKRIVGDQVQ